MVASTRATQLVAQLQTVADELIACVQQIDAGPWARVPQPGEWSVGKDAEHVIEGAAYHQWIVRQSLRQKGSDRPPVERERMTAHLAQDEVVRALREATRASASLIEPLTNEQLARPALPRRDKPRTLAEMIEGQLISHYARHQADIEAKLARLAR